MMTQSYNGISEIMKYAFSDENSQLRWAECTGSGVCGIVLGRIEPKLS